MSPATAIADWAAASSVIDGVLFAPPGSDEAPVCAVAVARGFRGYGKGLKQSDALVSAVGEALERWAAAQVDRAKLVWASFRELQRQRKWSYDVFDPRWLCLYSAEQYRIPHFPWRPFDENQPLHWVEGRWQDNGEPVYLPAFAAFLAGEFSAEALCQMSSNGLAAGRSVEDAGRRASLELYERDAFLTSWIALEGAARVETGDEAEGIAEIAARLDGQGARLETYLVAAGDAVFVAVSVGLGEDDRWPAVTMGLGAASNRSEAISKAILEHGQTGPYFAQAWRSKSARIPATPERIRTLQDNALYYCDASHRAEFDRWRDCGGSKSVVADGEVRIALADLTPPELVGSPFRVVRALARGLQPIYCGAAFERLPTARLRAMLADRIPNAAPPPIC